MSSYSGVFLPIFSKISRSSLSLGSFSLRGSTEKPRSSASAAGRSTGKSSLPAYFATAMVERSGARRPPGERMAPRDFYGEFSPLLLLLYDGEFSIT